MPRYAELPNGKRLSFDDKATDKEIQRTVRRELGLSQDDLIDAIQDLSKKIDAMLGALGKTDTKSHAGFDRLAASLAEHSIVLAHDGKRQEKFSADLTKLMSTQASLIRQLHDAAESLDKTADAAVGHSLAALNQSVAAAKAVAQTLEKATARLEAITAQLAKSVETLHVARRITKRARRNSDGSWTMEAL
jgi:chromosome segregation ATPase